MKKRNIIILICILSLVFFIQGFLAYSSTKIIAGEDFKIISILPEKVRVSKLLRIIDKEAGVICYILQNDTADFYSGLQCINVGKYHSILGEVENEDNREERHSKVGR